MFGLSLIHAGFLAAGLAAAVPILIHLLFRQRTRNVVIGSIRFLQQVVREHRKRRRVRQWILLALRMLAVLLLAALFSRPYWSQAANNGLTQEVVFLIDRSASMLATGRQGTSSFQRAISSAQAELSRLPDNVVIHLALFDSAGVKEIPVDELSSAQPNHLATNYASALTWARDRLASSTRETRRIVLVSDLQRTGLPAQALERLPAALGLSILDVGEALPKNVSIESAAAVSTELRPGTPLKLRVVIRNHSPLPVRDLAVTGVVEGSEGFKQSLQQRATVSGRSSAVLEFPVTIERDGLYKGHLAIAARDDLPLDDTRWLAFEARHPERILLVDGQEGRSNYGNETYYLETALRLRTEESGGILRSFEPDKMVWEAGEGFPKLDGYRAIVLANVRRLSETDGERLESYLREGGSLLIFAGDQVTSETLGPLARRNLLPGSVAEAPVDRRSRITQWDREHIALTIFNDPQLGDLRRIELQKFLPLQSTTPDSRILIQAGNDAIAAERSIGKGRCFYFGSTLDRDWTEWPRTPLFVPVVRQLLACYTDQLAARSAVTDRIAEKPDDRVGITAAIGATGQWVVTNVDPQESALDRITPEDLRKRVGGNDPHIEKDAATAELLQKFPPDSLRPNEIWPLITWLLLLVLAAETLLGSRIHA